MLKRIDLLNLRRDRLVHLSDLVMLYLNRLVLQPQHLAHGHDRYRLLTNLPNTKECIKLRIHTCAHMHAHLALLMLAVVTACCEETRRGRSKFTLVLRIIQLRAAGRQDSAILQLIQHFPRPRRIVHFKPLRDRLAQSSVQRCVAYARVDPADA